MSADRWAICPKCAEEAQATRKMLQQQLEDGYGKVPVSEYLTLLEESNKPVKLETTLREDYEVGIYKGEFFVNYSGGCTACGFSYEYEYEDKNIGEYTGDFSEQL